MPEWSLWLIPCVFALVFGYTVVLGAARARRPQQAAVAQAAEAQCPSRHRDAVSVQDVAGELVAWLCVDPACGGQLPKDWAGDDRGAETTHRPARVGGPVSAEGDGRG
jgi:hypothetical protein